VWAEAELREKAEAAEAREKAEGAVVRVKEEEAQEAEREGRARRQPVQLRVRAGARRAKESLLLTQALAAQPAAPGLLAAAAARGLAAAAARGLAAPLARQAPSAARQAASQRLVQCLHCREGQRAGSGERAAAYGGWQIELGWQSRQSQAKSAAQYSAAEPGPLFN
jgi:hypothetical protein